MVSLGWHYRSVTCTVEKMGGGVRIHSISLVHAWQLVYRQRAQGVRRAAGAAYRLDVDRFTLLRQLVRRLRRWVDLPTEGWRRRRRWRWWWRRRRRRRRRRCRCRRRRRRCWCRGWCRRCLDCWLRLGHRGSVVDDFRALDHCICLVVVGRGKGRNHHRARGSDADQRKGADRGRRGGHDCFGGHERKRKRGGNNGGVRCGKTASAGRLAARCPAHRC